MVVFVRKKAEEEFRRREDWCHKKEVLICVVVFVRKKAEEEYRRREDWRHKKEVLICVVVFVRKKAEEEYRRREDWRHKKEVLERRHQELQDTTSSTHAGSSDTLSGDASWLNCHQTKQGSASQLSSEGTRESGRQFFLTNVPASPVEETGADGGTAETKVFFFTNIVLMLTISYS